MKSRQYKDRVTLTLSNDEYVGMCNFIVTCMELDKKVGFTRAFDKEDKECLTLLRKTFRFDYKKPDGVSNVSDNQKYCPDL